MNDYPDVERVIEARFIKGLKRVFEFDDEFRYNVDDDFTKIIIAPDYPAGEDAKPFKTPQILVGGIAFQNDLQSGFLNNMEEDVALQGIKNYAQRHFFRVPYSLSLICSGEYDISRNLANRLFFYINFRAYEYLSNALNLNVQAINKGATGPRDQYPEKIFQTPLSVQGFTVISVVKTPFNYLDKNESKPINRLGETFFQTKINTEVD